MFSFDIILSGNKEIYRTGSPILPLQEGKQAFPDI